MQSSPHPYRAPSDEPIARHTFQQRRPFPASLLFAVASSLLGLVLIGVTGLRVFGLLVVIGVAYGQSRWRRWRVGRFGQKRGQIEVFADEAVLVGRDSDAIEGARLMDAGQTLHIMTEAGREFTFELRDFRSPDEFAKCVEDSLRVARTVELRLPPGVPTQERDAFLHRLQQEAARLSPAELEGRWSEFLSKFPAAVEHDEYQQRLQRDLDQDDS